jgi:long-subunit acyl-CoA synthetase (AMP-forming)
MTSRQSAPESLKFVAVGGARCATGLLQTARTQGLPAFEGYGLTECGSVVSLNLPDADLPGSMGHPLSHVRIHTGAEGEIGVESRVFLGYLHDPTPPRDVRPTGDLGRLDQNGFLHLSGRRKSLLITAFGRNVAPEWVEAALTAQPEIAQAVAVGEARPWLSALLAPMPGADATALERAVARANADLPDYAQIRGWLPVDPFTLKNGFATGNGRPRREAIATHYTEAIESLYQNKESAHVVL